LADFVHSPHAIAIGARADELMPTDAMAIGAIVDAKSDVITVFVADTYVAGMLGDHAGGTWTQARIL
jgi:hypothetical protein